MSPAAATSERASLRSRLRYRIDTAMSGGTSGVIVYLGFVTLALVVVAAIAVLILGLGFGGGKATFGEGLWQSLMRTIDSGAMGGDSGWRLRVVSLVVTLGGIFIVSGLIGLITTSIEGRVSELRKGLGPVLETGHIVVLGWAPKLFTILGELAIANESEPDSCVVILAEEDKVTMEDEVRRRVSDRRKTRVLCRTGSPSDPTDLERVNVKGAKAVLVLSPGSGADADATVIKAVLALLAARGTLSGIALVAELHDPANADALRRATNGEVLTVVSSEVIARVAAQVCRQTGLSNIYGELLQFEGDEIYFTDPGVLAGHPFRDALLSYEASAVIGLHRGGAAILAPDPDTVIEPSDRLVVISADDSTVAMTGVRPLPAVVRQSRVVDTERAAERFLVVGWNELAAKVLVELDGYVPDGSAVDVLLDDELVADGEVELPELERLAVRVLDAPGGERAQLVPVMRASTYDHVILLGYRTLTEDEADARSLLSLLQLRPLIDETGARQVTVVAELLDVRSVPLARVTPADDFIIGDGLTSLMLAQLVENPHLLSAYDDLFGIGGSELSMRAATTYREVTSAATFADVVSAVAAQGDIAIGVRTPAGIRLNLPKSSRITLAAHDDVIVIGR